MTIAEKVLRQLEAREPGTGLGREFYVDPQIHALELQMLFYGEWLFAAHTCELPSTGSFLTLRVGEYPIVIVRAADGAINAFINSCRHRGSTICQTARGTAPKLVCPYHQWTYSLDGSLFSARQTGAQIDRKQHGLRRVQCETVAGYIFVCLAPEAPDFTPVREQWGAYLGPHRFAEARVAVEHTIIEEGNWKLIWENNRECYHCAPNHPELARTFPDTPAVTGIGGQDADPTILSHWQKCEALGMTSAFRLTPDGQMRTTRVPLLGRSYTMSGQPAVRRALSDAIAYEHDIGALVAFNYPSTWNHALIDQGISFRVTPLGPKRTQVTTKWLVHRDAVEGVDYDLEELTHVWDRTNDQDRHIVEQNQIGIDAPTYTPGPFCMPQESGVLQFVDWYTGAMRRHLHKAVQG